MLKDYCNRVNAYLQNDESARGKLKAKIYKDMLIVEGWVFDKRCKNGTRLQAFWHFEHFSGLWFDHEFRIFKRYVEGNIPGVTPINFSKLAYMAPI